MRCAALDPHAPHVFSSRHLELSAERGWTDLARALDARAAVGLTQVHGNAVVVLRRGGAPVDGRPEADVLVSDEPDLAIVVRAADCVPLLMADRRTGAVAAVHAGWRGTAARAAVVALDAMRHHFGTSAADVVAAIGPSIGSCCYEVGPELVDAFAAAGHERLLIDRWFLVRPPARGTGRAVQVPPLRLDVAGANRDQLILAGVPETQVHVSGLCTAMHLDTLTSFRAERQAAGRLGAAIRARR